MKTTAFLIRVAICLLLSLVPLTELENRIYSARMEWRKNSTVAPQTVILEMSPNTQNLSPNGLAELRNKILKEKPALLLLDVSRNWNHLTHYLITDSDGMTRRANYMSHGRPSLANLAQARLNPNAKYLQDHNGPHLIHYIGPAGTIPTCTFDPHSTEFNCPSLQNKIVLLIENNDHFPLMHTPVGEMTPAEVLANEIQTTVFYEPFQEISTTGRLSITLGMILLGAFYIIYYPVLLSAIAISATGLVVIVGLFQVLFAYFNIYIASANMIASLLVTYLIFTGYRLAIQENLQWRSLKQAQYLRELDRMKTNFLSLMSHDLKTPLAKIQAVVERLRRELALPEESRSDWKELLDSIENSNNEMKRFITSILNLSKIESQKVILNKKTNDINQLIEQALKRLRPLAQQKNITIEQSLDPLFSIECDEDLMRQVLTNLIDNAIKYSPTNSKILVRSREEEGFVRVEVEDFGPGIPRDQLPLMFRKFSRFLRPIKEQVKGTGLGLYLSKYFIELHGGSIRVKSIEGQGTTFSFTLPLREMESEALLG